MLVNGLFQIHSRPRSAWTWATCKFKSKQNCGMCHLLHYSRCVLKHPHLRVSCSVVTVHCQCVFLLFIHARDSKQALWASWNQIVAVSFSAESPPLLPGLCCWASVEEHCSPKFFTQREFGSLCWRHCILSLKCLFYSARAFLQPVSDTWVKLCAFQRLKRQCQLDTYFKAG